MMISKKIIGLFILCFTASFLFGQQLKNATLQNKYLATHWQVANGLVHDKTYCMLKDINGFLWIGTEGGLSRFDGSTFKNYYFDAGKPGTIAGVRVQGLVEDSLHNIWVGTDKGLSRYDIKADTFSTLPTFKKSTFSTYVIPFWATKDKIFCEETDSLITSYDIHSCLKKIVARLTPADSVLNSGYSQQYSIVDINSNTLWMLQSQGGLLQISLSSEKRTHYPCPQSEAMCYDPKRNSIWINTDKGLIEFSLNDKQAHYIAALKQLEKQKAFGHIGIDLDSSGRVWFYTDKKGIIIYDPKDESFNTVFDKDAVLQQTIAVANSCIYCDKDGITWLGSWLRFGVYQLIPLSQVDTRYNTDISGSRGMHTNDIQNIIKAEKDQMWMGTSDGLIVFETKTDLFKTFREKDLPGLKGKTISPVFIDTAHKKAWLFVQDTGIAIYKMDMDSKKCIKVIFRDSLNKIIQPDFSKKIPVHYQNGCMLAVVYNKRQFIFIIDSDSAVAKQILSFPANTINYDMFNPTPVSDHFLFLRRPDILGNLTYTDTGGKWTRTHSPMDSIQWSAIFYNKSDLSYWVVKAQQIIHYDNNFHLIKQYNIEDGLPHDEIYGLITDNKGNIWFNTVRSIYQLDIKKGTVIILSEKNGFQPQDFKNMGEGIAKDVNGDLYFTAGGIPKGFERISPDKFFSPPSYIYIKSLAINKYALPLSTGANSIEQLSLKYFQNRINIETGTIDYYSKGKNIIRYKLEGDGRNENWQYGSSNFNIRYEDIPPGKYRLLIQAGNNNNAFNGPVKNLAFQISPAFWNTWWFRLLTGLCVAGSLYGFILYRSRNLKKQNIVLEEKVLHRTKELKHSLEDLKQTQAQLIQSEKMASLGELTAGIAHEIQNPLNFVNNFSEVNSELIDELEQEVDKGNLEEIKLIAKDIKENEQKINHHGKRADAIVKGMLQHSRTSTGVREPTDINALCDEYLRLSYHGLRAKDKNFNATLKTDFDTSLEKVNIIQQDIGRVILNLLNNAFYAVNEKKQMNIGGYEPAVSVSTKKFNNNVEIKVADNGNGIPQKVFDKIFQPFFTTKPTGQGTGLGLSLSYDIIKAHGGDLKVETKEGEASTFMIYLPIK